YSAPAVLSAAQAVTITATSTLDPTKSASVTVQLTPSRWSTQDIGAVNVAGTYSYANGAHTVTGSGDISGTSDAFRFVWQPMTGDGSIIAKVNVSGCCVHPEKAGVMFRDSLSPNAKEVFQGIYSGIAGLFESRLSPG